MIYLADAYDAHVKADHLLKQLAGAENLTVEQHRTAANDLLACAQMIATDDDLAARAQTLAALAVAHSAVAGIPRPAVPTWPTTEPAPAPAATAPSRVQFNRDGYQP